MKQAGSGQWQACCPAHEADGNRHDPSLSVSIGEAGRVLLHCHAGCPTADVLHALGLQESDLFADRGQRQQRPAAPRITATYDYCDAAGSPVYQVIRYVPKSFRQRRPDGRGGWLWNMNGVPRVLYRLPELLAADPEQWCFLPEGEKDVDNLAALGLTASCNPGGAMKWGKLSDDSTLHGRRVCIIADRDDVGRRHAQDVARRLQGRAAEVKVLELPGDQVKDASDWLEDHDAQEPQDLVAELLRLAEEAPIWTPAESRGPAATKSGSSPIILCLSKVQPQSIEWVWPGRMALGKLTLLVGDPGVGKSFLSLDIAARISTGRTMPGCDSERPMPAGVVLLSAEDDVADTIRPRLDAAEADVDRINCVPAVRRLNGDSGEMVEDCFNLEQDVPALETAIQATKDCRLVVLDPISAFLGRADSHVNAQVRGLLVPLQALAARYRVALLAVTHLRKGDGIAIHRAMGSLAFVAAARASYAACKDKNDPTGRRRLLLPMKNNLGNDDDGFAYVLDTDCSPNGQPVVTWEPGLVRMTADEAMRPPKPDEDVSELD
ncbi:MAG TPA: AAA family ATPase, partial [Planctomycetota bacterium]|nr:AAA family ATPase [Planctomycetota bacterium]